MSRSGGWVVHVNKQSCGLWLRSSLWSSSDSRPHVGNKLEWMISIYMANSALLFTLGLFTPFVKIHDNGSQIFSADWLCMKNHPQHISGEPCAIAQCALGSHPLSDGWLGATSSKLATIPSYHCTNRHPNRTWASKISYLAISVAMLSLKTF